MDETLAESVRQWKRQYGSVYSVSVRDVDYVFRELTFAEYDEVAAVDTDSAEVEDLLVEVALLHPTGVAFDRIPAGVITSLADEILEVSGFGTPRYAKSVLERHREDVEGVRGLMKAFVLATMPAYKEEELDALTFSSLARKVALSEKIIEVNQAAFGVENPVSLDLIDPEEEAEREAQQNAKHAASKEPGTAGANDPIAQKLRQALG